MSSHDTVPNKKRSQPGELNTGTEADFIGDGINVTGYSADPDRVLATVFKKSLSKDKLKGRDFLGTVMHVYPEGLLPALTPDMGEYYKVYKELERREIETGATPADAAAHVLLKANSDLFMIKVRIPELDLMIPDASIYNEGNKLGVKLSTNQILTVEEKESIKFISLHQTFVGKRGVGFLGASPPPAVNSIVKVTYDNLANLTGPQYLGAVAGDPRQPLADKLKEGVRKRFGCPGSQGDSVPPAEVIETRAKEVKKTSAVSKPEDQIKEIENKMAELSGKEDEASKETLEALTNKKKELQAAAETSPAPAPSGSGERREDPTIPPAAKKSRYCRVLGTLSAVTDLDLDQLDTLATPSSWQGNSAKWSYEKKLASLDSRFAPKVNAVIEALKARKGNDGQNFKPKVFFAWRSEEVQRELVRKGNSKVLFSFHNATKGGVPNAYAADIVDKRHAWGAAAEENGFWTALGEEARKVGLDWGGDWKGFRDVAHVQYHPNNRLAEVKRESRETATA